MKIHLFHVFTLILLLFSGVLGANDKVNSLKNEIAKATAIMAHNSDSAKNILLNVLEKAEKESNTDIIILIHKHLASIYGATGQYQKFFYITDKMLELGETTNRPAVKAAAYYLKATGHYHQSNFDDAIKTLMKSSVIYEELNQEREKSRIYNLLGSIYYVQGVYDKAKFYYQSKLTIDSIEGNTDNIATSYHNLAMLYRKEGELFKALKLENKAMNGYLLEKNERGLAASYHAVSEYLTALYDDYSVLEITKEPGFDLYSKELLLDSAIYYQFESIKLSSKLNNQWELTRNYIGLGDLLVKKGKYDEAIDFYETSLNMADSMGAKQNKLLSFNQLSKAYEIKSDYKNAYKYRTLQLILSDSIYASETRDKIVELENEFNTKQKEQQIKLQKAKIEKQEEESKRENLQKVALGVGLIMMAMLTALIYIGLRRKRRDNEIIIKQKALTEEKNREVTDSITYAKRLQTAILPPKETMQQLLPQSFVLFKPKDIVSGDFYWLENIDGKTLVAAIDCTGHGVPGAFMSIVGHNGLSKAINEYGLTQPSKILDVLHSSVKKTLQSRGSEVKDGMDLSVCALNKEKNTLEFSGAMNPLYHISNGELVETKGDKMAIAGETKTKPFTNHVIELKKGDTVYLLTDGFADQFGGDKGKKFKYKPFKDLLLSIQKESMEKQREILDAEFEKWKGDLEQIDDVCVIGVRV